MGKKINVLNVKGTLVTVIAHEEDDYVCLTDMAKSKEKDARAADVIKNWIRNRSTLEFLGTIFVFTLIMIIVQSPPIFALSII